MALPSSCILQRKVKYKFSEHEYKILYSTGLVSVPFYVTAKMHTKIDRAVDELGIQLSPTLTQHHVILQNI